MELPVGKLRSWPRFKRLWPGVRQLLEQGYTIRAIHGALRAEGSWSSGYDVFRRHVAHAKRTLNEAPAPASQAESSPAVTGQAESPQVAAASAASAAHAVSRAAEKLRGHPALKSNPLLRPIERDAFDYKPSKDTEHLY